MSTVMSKTELELRAIGIYTTGENLTVSILEAMTGAEKIEYIDNHLTTEYEFHNPNTIYKHALVQLDEDVRYLESCGVTVVASSYEVNDIKAEGNDITTFQKESILVAVNVLKETIDCIDMKDIVDHKRSCGDALGLLLNAFPNIQ